MSYVKFNVKLVLEEVMDVPAFPEPFSALFVGFEAEPIVVCLFVVLNVLKFRKNTRPYVGS